MVRSHRARLGVQQLERRENPAAGNVLASVNALGDLVIKGDGNVNGNDVLVEVGPLNTFVLLGKNGTAVNGDAVFPAVFNGVTRDVTATFLGGNDSFKFNSMGVTPVTTLRDIHVNMGAGSDTVVLQDLLARNVSVAQPAADVNFNTTTVSVGAGAFKGAISGNLSVVNGIGVDTATIEAAVGGKVTVAGHKGHDTMVVKSDSQIGGSLAVTNSGPDGANAVTVGGHVGGNVTITAPGAKDSTATVFLAVIGENVTLTNGTKTGEATTTVVSQSQIGGALKVVGGAGDDKVTFVAAQVGKTLTVQNGAGANTTDVQNNTNVTGKASVTGGAGADTVTAEIGASSFGGLAVSLGDGTNGAYLSQAHVNGNLSVTGGAGADDFRTTATGTSTAAVLGNATFNLGGGNNLMYLFGASTNSRLAIGGNLSLTSGSGNDFIIVQFVNVAGKTAVTTGSMGDVLGIDDCQFTGNFAANLGADGDAFHLDTDPAAPGKTEFLGNLSINAGASADAVTVTVAGPEAMEATAVYVYGTVAITGAETLTINPVNAHHVGHATFP